MYINGTCDAFLFDVFYGEGNIASCFVKLYVFIELCMYIVMLH